MIREEAFFLQIVPHRLRQVPGLVDDLEVVHHGASRVSTWLSIRPALLRSARPCRSRAVLPVRVAAKQLPVPPDGAGLHGLPPGGRQGGSIFLKMPNTGGSPPFTDGGDTEHHGYRQHQQDKQCDHTEVPSISLFPLIIVGCYTARRAWSTPRAPRHRTPDKE